MTRNSKFFINVAGFARVIDALFKFFFHIRSAFFFSFFRQRAHFCTPCGRQQHFCYRHEQKREDDEIACYLHNVKHPCRFEYIQDKNILIDAAHNPNGASALRASLDWYFPDKKRRFIFGCLKTKDYEKMMDILFSEGDEIYLNHFDYPGSVDFETLQAACKYPAKQFKSLDEINLNDGKLTIICGSFYMLKDILAGIAV